MEDQKFFYVLMQYGEVCFSYWAPKEDGFQYLRDQAQEGVSYRISDMRHLLPVKVTPEIARDLDTYGFRFNYPSFDDQGKIKDDFVFEFLDLDFQGMFDDYYRDMKEDKIRSAEMEEKRFINENEVSTITGMSVQTLRNWRFQGKGIPYVKAGRSVRYQYQDVITYMEDRVILPREQVK